MALSLTRANPLPNKLPNHISEAFLVARSKYKDILSNVSLGGGARSLKGGAQGGQDPLGFGSGGARSLGIWPWGSEITGGGGEIPGIPVRAQAAQAYIAKLAKRRHYKTVCIRNLLVSQKS